MTTNSESISHMDETLSRDSAVPLYQQIKQNLLQDIESGILEPHTQLPSERKLVEQYGVSRITVRQALSELVQQGYLYAKPAKGFFVAEQPQPYELNVLLSFTSVARERGLNPSGRVLEADIVPASQALARQLLIPLGAEVVFLVRLRLINDMPVRIEQVWLPHDRCPGILKHDLNEASLYAILRDEFGLVLTQAHTTIRARLASAQEREWLELADPDAVVTVDQLTLGQDGRPIELSLMVIHPRRYPLSLDQTQAGVILGAERGAM
jgi:GntR family transcriptional regulator